MELEELLETAERLERKLSELLPRPVRVPVVEAFVRRCGCQGLAFHVKGLTVDDVEVLGGLLSEELSRIGHGRPAAELRSVGPKIRSLLLIEPCDEHAPEKNPSLLPIR